MTHRALYRAAASDALRNTPEFYRLTERLSWVYGADVSDLPAWGVMTPDEPATDLTKESTRRDTDLMVIVKRTGGDELQDQLDEDAAVIECNVWPALEATAAYHVTLTRTRIDISSDGATRSGLVEVTFRCTAEIDNP